MQALEHPLLVGGQVSDYAVQEQRGLVEQPLRRTHVLQHDALRHRLQLRLLVRSQILTGEDDHWHVGELRLRVHLREQLEPRHVGQTQVEHDAVERLAAQRIERFAASPYCNDLDVIVSEQLDDRLALDLAILDHQQPLRARGGEGLDSIERGLERVGSRRFDEVRERAVCQSVLTLFLERENLHRDMARRGIELELIQHGPTQHVGQEDVEGDRGRLELACQ